MAPQQFQAGVPVVVPPAFSLQLVDVLGGGTPAAVVLNCFLKSTAVAASHIADHTIDVEEQDGWESQNV